MRKLKIYIDATLPNYVFNLHTPEKQRFAKTLFDEIQKGKYEVYISKVVVDEISAAPEPKQTRMANLIKDIPVLDITEECNELAQEYITRGIIPVEHKNDALHIAIATFYNIDALVSYNFEHIVKLKTIREVSGTNIAKGYKIIDLVIPEEVLGE